MTSDQINMKNNTLYLLLCLICSSSLSAQSIHYNYNSDNFVRLEYNRPILNDFGEDFFTFASFLAGEFRVGNQGKIAVEIPFSRLGGSFGFDSNTAIGNIGVGYQFRNFDTSNYFEVKFRLPTLGDNNLAASSISTVTDFTERLTSSIPSTFSIESSYNLESNSYLGLYYRFRPQLLLLISSDTDTELLLNLNLIGGYRTPDIDINAGITTSTLITESNVDFDNRVLRQISTSFTYNAGQLKPGVLLRAPISGGVINDVYDISIGVHLTYAFGGTSTTQVNDN